jgi:hypothetical protein
MELDGTQVPPWIPLRAIGAAEKALAAAICFDDEELADGDGNFDVHALATAALLLSPPRAKAPRASAWSIEQGRVLLLVVAQGELAPTTAGSGERI